MRTNRLRSLGDVNAEPDDDFVKVQLARSSVSTSSNEPKLVDLFEQYAEQRVLEGKKRTASIEKDRRMIASLVEHVGRHRTAASIEKRDVRDWIEIRAKLPKGFEKMKRYAGKSLKEALVLAQDDHKPRPTPQTLNSYLSAVSALFGWLIARGHHPGPSPCEYIFYEAQKGKNPRPPFDSPTLNAILSSPLFSGFLRDGREHEAGNATTRDWRFWIPLVCMFTGARVSEVAQLRVSDVRDEGGVWTIHILHAQADGVSTKSGESRLAPVHSTLIRIGFIRFIEARAAVCKGGDLIFPEAVDTRLANPGDKAGKFWRRYLESIGVKEKKGGGDGKGVHSFRQTIADRFREEAELLDSQIAIALGHSVKTVTSGYGTTRQGTINFMRDAFEAVRFDGVDFSHLFERDADNRT